MYDEFEIVDALWGRDHPRLLAVRAAVFVHEQGVPPELEVDEYDAVSEHVMAVLRSGDVVGTARLLPDGHIGRMAVLKSWRGRGLGSAMLRRLLGRAWQQGHRHVDLNAQTHAAAFYQRLGFAVTGAAFMDAGIPHLPMRIALQDGTAKGGR